MAGRSRQPPRPQQDGWVGQMFSMRRKPPTVYRRTKIGKALKESLAVLTKAGKISSFLETHILKEFDLRMAGRMGSMGSIGNPAPIYFEARTVARYRLLDGAWEIHCKKVNINSDDMYVEIPRLVIFADRFSEEPWNLNLPFHRSRKRSYSEV